jgi:hypothetical protein
LTSFYTQWRVRRGVVPILLERPGFVARTPPADHLAAPAIAPRATQNLGRPTGPYSSVCDLGDRKRARREHSPKAIRDL